MARDIKEYLTCSFADLSVIATAFLYLVLLVVPMQNFSYAPNVILSLLWSRFGDTRMISTGMRLLDTP